MIAKDLLVSGGLALPQFFKPVLDHVPDAPPHRFRDTFCVDMLARDVNPYNVARLAGITVEVLEKHYAPFVPELHDRVHAALETRYGLESIPSVSRTVARKQVQ